MNVLIVGSTSFASQGLIETLEVAGHTVWTFNRRHDPLASARSIAGDWRNMESLCRVGLKFDCVINFMILKDLSVNENLEFCAILSRLVQSFGVRRLVHISSISVLPAISGTVSEITPADQDMRDKGAYSQIKIATELWLSEHIDHCELVIIRPGFILGKGLADPIVGIGVRVPTKHLLGLGNSRSIVPIIARSILHKAIERALSIPLNSKQTVLMLVDPESPSRVEYLQYCCREFGLGSKPIHLPNFVWLPALTLGSRLLQLVGRPYVNLVKRIRHNLWVRTYDCTFSERFLSISFRDDWKHSLREAMGREIPNFVLPEWDMQTSVSSGKGTLQPTSSVLYVGVGRIVRERHFPALYRIGFKGTVEWYDPNVLQLEAPSGLRMRRLKSLEETTSSRAVVAVPGSVRKEILNSLPDDLEAVLVEKPAAASADELDALLAMSRRGRMIYGVHNYRFKPNVRDFCVFIRTHNSGELRHVRLTFDSPPVRNDRAAWLRNERSAKTLVLDYAIHFIDLAFLFANGSMTIESATVDRNPVGETECVRAMVTFDNYTCDFFLRQGALRRRCHLEFIFQNYTLFLRFFPELFWPVVADYNFLDDLRCGLREFKSTVSKVTERLALSAQEPSHLLILASFLGYSARSVVDSLHIEQLAENYRRLLKLIQRVYD